jgi:hypothetical protein
MNNTRYMNLDLLLNSEQDLTPLITEFGDRVFVLCNEPNPEGGWYTALEPSLSDDLNESPQSHAIRFLESIHNLSPDGKKLWGSCTSRIFDFGFEGGHEPFSLTYDLSTEVLSGISALGARMRISLYAVPESPNQLFNRTQP